MYGRVGCEKMGEFSIKNTIIQLIIVRSLLKMNKIHSKYSYSLKLNCVMHTLFGISLVLLAETISWPRIQVILSVSPVMKAKMSKKMHQKYLTENAPTKFNLNRINERSP